MIRLLSSAVWPMRRIVFTVLFLATLVAATIARADAVEEIRRLHESGQTTAALTRIGQALAGQPKEPQLRFLKGVILADSRRAAEAIEVFSALSEDYPELAEPYNNLAALHAAAGDYDRARTTLEQALRSNPDYTTAHRNLGDVHVMLAGRSYGQALKLSPTEAHDLLPRLALVRELLGPRLPVTATAPR